MNQQPEWQTQYLDAYQKVHGVEASIKEVDGLFLVDGPEHLRTGIAYQKEDFVHMTARLQKRIINNLLKEPIDPPNSLKINIKPL